MSAVHFFLPQNRPGLRLIGKAARLLPRFRDFRPLTPYGFWIGCRSSLTGAGGDSECPVEGYAFQTAFAPAIGGLIRFRVAITDLVASAGRLALTLNTLDGKGVFHRSQRVEVGLDELVARGGTILFERPARADHAYSLGGQLIDSADASAAAVEVSVAGMQDARFALARVEDARADFLSLPGEDVLADIVVHDQPTLDAPISQMCTAEQMLSPLYADLCARMGQVPSRHRKQWEFAYVLRALEYHGALKPGARGLVFGVGIEPLPAVFAGMGCEIVATDLASEDDRAQAWNDTNQLGSSPHQLFYPGLCDEKDFYDRVTFRPVDMNAIPEDLTGFDFTWSSCAFEHLGNIEAGLAFYRNSLKCLKPGGIAVHTTEFNLSSNDRTLDNDTTVLFRRRDFEALARRLIAEGHDVLPISFESGSGDLDRVIDMPPYANDPHLKIALLSWVTTSFGLIARKGGSER